MYDYISFVTHKRRYFEECSKLLFSIKFKYMKNARCNVNQSEVIDIC